MPLSRELLFFFSGLGAFNGLLCGLYFLFLAKPPDLSRKLFGGFVLALSLRVGKSVFYYFYRDLALEYLQLGLTACLFIGPLLYFFVWSVAEPESTLLRKQLRGHLLGWTIVALLAAIFYSYRTYTGVWRQYIVFGIYAVWGIYTLAAAWKSRDHFRRLLGAGSVREGDRMVVLVTLGTLVVLGCYTFATFTSYISGALAFSLLLYSTWVVYRFPRPAPEPSVQAVGEATALLNEAEVHTFSTRLESAMVNDRLYIDADLKLADLATALGCTSHQLSYLLNQEIGRSFHRYLNEYRVELAKQLIHTEDHLTLEAIGLSCGFNARSTFYKAFRRVTGTTPAKFRESIRVKS